jgi:hypothetical protein
MSARINAIGIAIIILDRYRLILLLKRNLSLNELRLLVRHGRPGRTIKGGAFIIST